MAASITTAQLAEALSTTPRELRKFLRSTESPVSPVGKGSRYSLEGTKPAIARMRKAFDKWDAARKPAVEAESTESE